MASYGHRTQPTFTIEQIELIRRLRNSGLTKEQVVQAFESLERVDAELGNLYTVPMSLSQPKSFALAATQAASVARTLHPHSTSNISPNFHQEHTVPVAPSSQTSSGQTPVHINRRFQGVKRPREISIESDGGSDESRDGPSPSVTQLTGHDLSSMKSVGQTENDKVMAKRVDDFLKKGADRMLEEIRDFYFAHPNFTHNDIAAAAGVSVTCVSKFLVGNFASLPSQVLRLLSQWFLTMCSQRSQPQPKQILLQQQLQQQCNSTTSKMLRDVVQERLNGDTSPSDLGMSFNGSVDVLNMGIKQDPGLEGMYGANGNTPGGLEVHFTPRRERFTFRKKHLEILEAYFKNNQYPSYEERTEIANRCNDIMEVVAGRGLGEKERMTAQNVAYWFSNRRKDIKRIAREGGIDMSEVILPSRVRQSPPPPSFVDGREHAGNISWTNNPMTMNYAPIDMPNVGPIAFPMATRPVVDNSVVGEMSFSSDSQSGSDVVHIKPEPPDNEFQRDRATPLTMHGRGSAVERIAAEISSQLLSAANLASSSGPMTPENSPQKPQTQDELRTGSTDHLNAQPGLDERAQTIESDGSSTGE